MATSACLWSSSAPPRTVPLGPQYTRERRDPAPLHYGCPQKGGWGGLIEASPRRDGSPGGARGPEGAEEGRFRAARAHHRHTGPSSLLADKELVRYIRPAIRRSSFPRSRLTADAILTFAITCRLLARARSWQPREVPAELGPRCQAALRGTRGRLVIPGAPNTSGVSYLRLVQKSSTGCPC